MATHGNPASATGLPAPTDDEEDNFSLGTAQSSNLNVPLDAQILSNPEVLQATGLLPPITLKRMIARHLYSKTNAFNAPISPADLDEINLDTVQLHLPESLCSVFTHRNRAYQTHQDQSAASTAFQNTIHQAWNAIHSDFRQEIQTQLPRYTQAGVQYYDSVHFQEALTRHLNQLLIVDRVILVIVSARFIEQFQNGILPDPHTQAPTAREFELARQPPLTGQLQDALDETDKHIAILDLQDRLLQEIHASPEYKTAVAQQLVEFARRTPGPPDTPDSPGTQRDHSLPASRTTRSTQRQPDPDTTPAYAHGTTPYTIMDFTELLSVPIFASHKASYDRQIRALDTEWVRKRSKLTEKLRGEHALCEAARNKVQAHQEYHNATHGIRTLHTAYVALLAHLKEQVLGYCRQGTSVAKLLNTYHHHSFYGEMDQRLHHQDLSGVAIILTEPKHATQCEILFDYMWLSRSPVYTTPASYMEGLIPVTEFRSALYTRGLLAHYTMDHILCYEAAQRFNTHDTAHMFHEVMARFRLLHSTLKSHTTPSGINWHEIPDEYHLIGPPPNTPPNQHLPIFNAICTYLTNKDRENALPTSQRSHPPNQQTPTPAQLAAIHNAVRSSHNGTLYHRAHYVVTDISLVPTFPDDTCQANDQPNLPG